MPHAISRYISPPLYHHSPPRARRNTMVEPSEKQLIQRIKAAQQQGYAPQYVDDRASFYRAQRAEEERIQQDTERALRAQRREKARKTARALKVEQAAPVDPLDDYRHVRYTNRETPRDVFPNPFDYTIQHRNMRAEPQPGFATEPRIFRTAHSAPFIIESRTSARNHTLACPPKPRHPTTPSSGETRTASNGAALPLTQTIPSRLYPTRSRTTPIGCNGATVSTTEGPRENFRFPPAEPPKRIRHFPVEDEVPLRSTPTKRLAPLSRFNPFVRARSESLSSIEDELPLTAAKLKRNASVSALFARIHREAEYLRVPY
ncbi:hypothetical protein C8J57DRAFT_1210764 [Mycena rebaudengoi]|nr:hypothetical protein C8J57DRAFT_1210764 [Mycena rebaudengoi]